ncbi:MoaF-related domain-containing protein [Escherichia coli]
MSNKDFPGLGLRYLADYGEFAFHVDFSADGRTLRWADAKAVDFDAAATTETYSAIQIRPGVFWVTWKESDGITVSHAEDFENERIYAAITIPNQDFITVTGRWIKLN